MVQVRTDCNGHFNDAHVRCRLPATTVSGSGVLVSTAHDIANHDRPALSAILALATSIRFRTKC